MTVSTVARSVAAAALVAGALSYTTPSLVAERTAADAVQAPATPAAPDFRSRASRCGVKEIPEAQQALIEQLVNNAAPRRSRASSVVTIPVHWHIITTSTGGGNVTALVPDQMQVLNDAFAGAGFAFEQVSLEVVPNNAWFFAEAESPEEVAMKAALRRGGPESLNIYTTNGDVYLGWATFPAYYKLAPSYDGVVLWWAALPGTGLSGPNDDEPDGVLTYDQGDTGTHEVGHWLGLMHTFAGGNCSRPGDKIKDTPTEAEPQFFCQVRDSCTGPQHPGDDPITNFMDYVDDVCMDHFTPEQAKRMQKHWHAFRDK
jgi:hypothetical protein